MKIFWRDKEGKTPPPEALFSWRPFFPGPPPSLIENVARVEILPAPLKKMPIVKRYFLPEKKEWTANVEKALTAIREGEMAKVVLARCCILECTKPPDPFAITSALLEKSEQATLFCLSDGKTSFLGATPERLFIRKGDAIKTEAVAGTKQRGETPLEDLQLEKALLESSKDLREFAPVQHFLHEKLSSLCTSPLSQSPLRVRKAQNVQHLFSSLSGILKEGVSNHEILEQLHPTPALAGVPRKTALQWIREIEPFERGLYGGAIGWSTESASEWIVAIRCCLVQGRFVHLYTGTGIVEGSNPEEEWEELNVKMKLYEGIFG